MNDLILIADDDRDIRKILSKILEKEGFLIETAEDGAEFIHKMSKNVSVAFVDMMMPYKNGIECLEYAKENFPNTQVIMVSAIDELESVIGTMKLGAYDYIPKPFNNKSIRKLSHKALEVFKTYQEIEKIKIKVEKLSKFPDEDPNPVFRIDHSEVITYANKSASQILKEHACQIGGKASGEILDAFVEVTNSKQSLNIEVKYIDDIFLLTFVPISKEKYINVYGYKITELVDKEKRIKTLLENVVDGIITVDEKGTIESLNPAVENFFGYSTVELIGENIRILMPDEIQSNQDQYIFNYLTTGEAQVIGKGQEALGKKKDSTLFPIELSIGRYHLGNKTYFTVVIRDITERKKVEVELNLAREHEIEIGNRIQQSLLKESIPIEFPGIKIAALSVPSQKIDGDFYDFFVFNNNNLDIIVGDVMGKGIPAALIGAGAKSRFSRSITRLLSLNKDKDIPSPRDIMTSVHGEITHQLISVDRFITLFYARLDTYQNVMRYVDCGHSYAIHYQPEEGILTHIRGDNMPLGFSEWENYQEREIALQKNDLLIFYSDGIVEAKNGNDELFGDQRFSRLIRSSYQGDVNAFIKVIYETIIEFSGSEHFQDDVTCVVVKLDESNIIQQQLTVKSDLSELARIRQFIRSFCEDLTEEKLDEQKINLLELGINELASNIIRHGYKGLSDQQIDLKAHTAPGKVVVDIFDEGEAYNPLHFKPLVINMYREGGFGLYIINTSVDEIKYERSQDGRNHVSLVQYFNKNKGE